MTSHPLHFRVQCKLPVLAFVALMSGLSWLTAPMLAAKDPVPSRQASAKTKASPPAVRPAPTKRPDPRYRPPANFAELQAVAGEVAKATGRQINWHLALGENPGPLARVRGNLDNCTIYIHPVAAQKLPPNTWAFIFGHEFAHKVEGLQSHGKASPATELKADIAGARYAMASGYRLEAFLGWILTEPDQHTDSHGSPHERANAIAAHFGIPQRVIQAETRRYAKYRATH